MSNLNPLEIRQLKSLLSGKALLLKEKITASTALKILRTKCPDFFTSLKPYLTEAQLKDDTFLIKYLSDPANKNKIKNALRNEPSLSAGQQIELEESLETPAIIEAGGQPTGQENTTPAGQEAQQTGPAGNSSTGGAPSMPPAPSFTPQAPRRVFTVPQTSPPTGMETAEGTGQGTAATKKSMQNTSVSGMKGGTGQGTAVSSKSIAPTTVSNNPKPAAAPNLHPTAAPGFNFSALGSKLSGLGKEAQKLASSMGPGLKLNSSRVARGLGGIAGNVGGSLAHTGLPSAYNALSKTGMKGANFIGNTGGRISRLKNSVRRPSWASPKGAMGKRIAIIIFLGLFGTTFLTGFTGSSGTDSIPIPGSSIINPSDISQCQFTRAGSKAQFQSPLLLSYIQEAAQRANIPPAVLAAFIRVESPSSASKTDDTLSDYAAACTKSTTGALGIMQIQPPGTKSEKGDEASCGDCIDAGAKLVGKTVSVLTRADYCDLRTNIIIGAGFILKKMSKLGYGDGTKWDPKWTNDKQAIEALVNTYYGCLNYGGADDCVGPYNYADDVSTSIQSCQTSAPISYGGTALEIVKQWAQTINNLLDKTSSDKLLAPVTNGSYTTGDWSKGGYACTYLVIDAFNLANIPGLTKSAHGWVGAMENFWRSASAAGYFFLDYRQNRSILNDVQPGYAMFQQEKPGVHTGNEHVSIVQSTNIDSHGNGSIVTLDSNTGKYKGWTYQVRGWVIDNNLNPTEIITGFGGHQ